MKKILILVVLITAIAATLFLGGCYILCIDCVCPSPQETHPQILETIYFCDLLEYMRGWAPCAAPRELTLLYFDLTSKADIQWGLNEIGPWGCCMSYSEINKLRQLEGYEKVPIGYVEYSNGTVLNVVVCKEEGKIKAFLLVNGKFEELISDPLIVKIVI